MDGCYNQHNQLLNNDLLCHSKLLTPDGHKINTSRQSRIDLADGSQNTKETVNQYPQQLIQIRYRKNQSLQARAPQQPLDLHGYAHASKFFQY